MPRRMLVDEACKGFAGRVYGELTMKKYTQYWMGALVMPLAMSVGLAQAGDMADDGKMMAR